MRSAAQPGKGNILFQSKEDPLMQVRVAKSWHICGRFRMHAETCTEDEHRITYLIILTNIYLYRYFIY
jgi:hypothetical protein